MRKQRPRSQGAIMRTPNDPQHEDSTRIADCSHVLKEWFLILRRKPHHRFTQIVVLAGTALIAGPPIYVWVIAPVLGIEQSDMPVDAMEPWSKVIGLVTTICGLYYHFSFERMIRSGQSVGQTTSTHCDQERIQGITEIEGSATPIAEADLYSFRELLQNPSGCFESRRHHD